MSLGRPQRRLITAVLLAVAAACGGDGPTIIDSPQDTTGEGGGGGVQTAALTVSLQVVAEDQAIASLLHWTGGQVPGAEVTIRRSGADAIELTDTADAAGVVRFNGLLAGSYHVSVYRPLREHERNTLPPDLHDVTAIAGGGSVEVQPPAAEAKLRLVAGRRGSLVFSEIYPHEPRLQSGNWYVFGKYFELYNNSDSTIYLDGKIIARGIAWLADYDVYPCDGEMRKWRLEAEGVWSRYHYRFPGGGTQYPLRPGETAVVATDALDHGDFVPGLPDLAHADFEFIGSNDVDNPLVPNMIDVGFGEWDARNGHGAYVTAFHMVWALFEATELGDLPIDYLPVVAPEYRRLPSTKLLDVFSSGLTPAKGSALTPLCSEIIHSSLDRRHAFLVDGDVNASIRRPVLVTRDDGQVILQRTRTSARDFELRPGTPGRVP